MKTAEVWITNGQHDKTWPPDRPIPEGFIQGRSGSAAFRGGQAGRKKPARGPEKGTVGYWESDIALVPEFEQLMQSKGWRRTRAARHLAESGKIAGLTNDVDSRVSRFLKHYRETLI